MVRGKQNIDRFTATNTNAGWSRSSPRLASALLASIGKTPLAKT